MTNKMKIKIACSVIAIVVVLIGYGYYASASWTYSVGTRSGVIVKFSKKGTFYKTWEGELSQGSVDQGGVREKFLFSIESDQLQMTRNDEDELVSVKDGKRVVDLAQDALDHGKRVKLLYRQQLRVQSWKGKTDYFIVDVESLEQ